MNRGRDIAPAGGTAAAPVPPPPPPSDAQCDGRWGAREHDLYLVGLREYGLTGALDAPAGRARAGDAPGGPAPEDSDGRASRDGDEEALGALIYRSSRTARDREAKPPREAPSSAAAAGSARTGPGGEGAPAWRAPREGGPRGGGVAGRAGPTRPGTDAAPTGGAAVANAGKWSKWSAREHLLYLSGLRRFGMARGTGRHEKLVSLVATRTARQIQTHEQRYFQLLARARQRGDEHFHFCGVHVRTEAPDRPVVLSRPTTSDVANAGQWSAREHLLYLYGLREFGTYSGSVRGKKFVSMVTTRTAKQIESHQREYLRALAKARERGERDGGATVANTGKWSAREHLLYLSGLRRFGMLPGRGWGKKFAPLVITRTTEQIRTHQQKYFQRLAKARERGDKRVSFCGVLVRTEAPDMPVREHLGEPEFSNGSGASADQVPQSGSPRIGGNGEEIGGVPCAATGSRMRERSGELDSCGEGSLAGRVPCNGSLHGGGRDEEVEGGTVFERTRSTNQGAGIVLIGGRTVTDIGRWSAKEHLLYLLGLRKFGMLPETGRLKKFASLVATRTSGQVQSHEQKYFQMLARALETEEEHVSFCDVTVRTETPDAHDGPVRENSGGRWSAREHILYLDGLRKFGAYGTARREKFLSVVTTRAAQEIQSHQRDYMRTLIKARESGDEYLLFCGVAVRVDAPLRPVREILSEPECSSGEGASATQLNGGLHGSGGDGPSGPLKNEEGGGKKQTNGARAKKRDKEALEKNCRELRRDVVHHFRGRGKTGSGCQLPAMGTSKGRWTAEEHHLFLVALHRHGENWTKIAQAVRTRSAFQVERHAEKHLEKMAKAGLSLVRVDAPVRPVREF